MILGQIHSNDIELFQGNTVDFSAKLNIFLNNIHISALFQYLFIQLMFGSRWFLPKDYLSIVNPHQQSVNYD